MQLSDGYLRFLGDQWHLAMGHRPDRTYESVSDEVQRRAETTVLASVPVLIDQVELWRNDRRDQRMLYERLAKAVARAGLDEEDLLRALTQAEEDDEA
jgi:hypothetical protein